MEYLTAFRELFASFVYWPQVLCIAGAVCIGYLLHAGFLRMRIRRQRVRYEGRNMVLIEQKGRGKRRKNASAEYFRFINSAQYAQNDGADSKNKASGVSVIERD